MRRQEGLEPEGEDKETIAQAEIYCRIMETT